MKQLETTKSHEILTAIVNKFKDSLKLISTTTSFGDFVKEVDKILAEMQSAADFPADKHLKFFEIFSRAVDEQSPSLPSRVPRQAEDYCLGILKKMFERYKDQLATMIEDKIHEGDPNYFGPPNMTFPNQTFGNSTDSQDDDDYRWFEVFSFQEGDKRFRIAVDSGLILLTAFINSEDKLIFVPGFLDGNKTASPVSFDRIEHLTRSILGDLSRANITCIDDKTIHSNQKEVENFYQQLTKYFADKSTFSEFFEFLQKLNLQEISNLYRSFQIFSSQGNIAIYESKPNLRDDLFSLLQEINKMRLEFKTDSGITDYAKATFLKYELGKHIGSKIFFDHRSSLANSMISNHEQLHSFLGHLEQSNFAFKEVINHLVSQGINATIMTQYYGDGFVANYPHEDYQEMMMLDVFMVEMIRQMSIRYGLGKELFEMIKDHIQKINPDLMIREGDPTLQNTICPASNEILSTSALPTTIPSSNSSVSASSSQASSVSFPASSSTTPPPSKASLVTGLGATSTGMSSVLQSSVVNPALNHSATSVGYPAATSVATSSANQGATSDATLGGSSAVTSPHQTLFTRIVNRTNIQTNITSSPDNSSDTSLRNSSIVTNPLIEKLIENSLEIELPTASARALSMILTSYYEMTPENRELFNSVTEQLTRLIAVSIVKGPEVAGIGLASSQLISSSLKIPKVKEIIQENSSYWQGILDSQGIREINNYYKKLPPIVQNFANHFAFALIFYSTTQAVASSFSDREDKDISSLTNASISTLTAIVSATFNSVASFVASKFSKRQEEVGVDPENQTLAEIVLEQGSQGSSNQGSPRTSPNNDATASLGTSESLRLIQPQVTQIVAT